MRKVIVSVLAVCTIFLTSCLETTQEITLKDDGSGTLSNMNDMSAIIPLVKQMGGSDIDKLLKETMDSIISLANAADSIPDLTPTERGIVKKTTVHLYMDIKAEKLFTNMSFPFSSGSEIQRLIKLSGKIMTLTLNDKMMEEGSPVTEEQMPEFSSFDDYYTMEFSNGELTKKVNKEKYAGVESDEYLKAMKEASSMGLPMKANYIINLPRPATKAEGKNVTLSADKMKVTISADVDDFFDDASSLEFKIKY